MNAFEAYMIRAPQGLHILSFVRLTPVRISHARISLFTNYENEIIQVKIILSSRINELRNNIEVIRSSKKKMV